MDALTTTADRTVIPQSTATAPEPIAAAARRRAAPTGPARRSDERAGRSPKEIPRPERRAGLAPASLPGRAPTGTPAGPGRLEKRRPLRNAEPAPWDRMRFRPALGETRGAEEAVPASERLTAPGPERRTPERTAAPDPSRAPAAAATALVVSLEVLAGRRPAAQLTRCTTPELADAIARRAGLASRILGDRAREAQPRLRSVRAQRTPSGDFEIMATAAQGGRTRAAAARLTERRGRWVLSELEVA